MIRNILTVATFAFALSATPSLAASGPTNPGTKWCGAGHTLHVCIQYRVCTADIRAHCAGVQAGEGRIRACVLEHFSEFSEACQTNLLNASTVRNSCAADATQFCADVKPGGGRIAMCLRPHLADLSQPCKDALAQAVSGNN
jgi:hypothetical protein